MESRIQPQSIFNDDWDSVVDFEGRMFENGRHDGCTDAIQSGEMYQNGVQAGFLKGFAYGLELGFMEAVASSFTTSAAVKDIGSDDVKLSSNGADIEDSNCNAECSNDAKNDNDDCRSTSIFPNIGKNPAVTEISDGNNNSKDVCAEIIGKVNILVSRKSSENTHVKDGVGSDDDNNYYSNDNKEINNLNEDIHNVGNVRIGNNDLNESTASISSSSGSTIVRTSVSNSVSTSNKRISKRCTEIVQRSKAVPNRNIDSFDFDKEVIELRGLYKVSGSTVGLFRPLLPMKDNKKQNVTVSNEW